MPHPEHIPPKVILIEQNDNYNGLHSYPRQSKFLNLYLDPIYKFPTVSASILPHYISESSCYHPDAVKASEFFGLLHDSSPFKTPCTSSQAVPIPPLPQNKAPRNSLQGSEDSLSLSSFHKPFNLGEEMDRVLCSLASSSILSLSLSPDHPENLAACKNKGKTRNRRSSHCLEGQHFNSVSSINFSQLSGNEPLLNLNFSNVDISGIECENRSRRLYQKADDNTEVLSNDEAVFTVTKTEESFKRNPFLVELVPETEEENSWMMYRSIEALRRVQRFEVFYEKKEENAEEDEEDLMSLADDEGPLMVDPGRLFLNGETASKAKLSGAFPLCRVIQKITQKLLTDSSDMILSTVPETQPSTDHPDMFSPLLKKLVVLEGSRCTARILRAITACGFNSALSIEFSSEEAQCKITPIQRKEEEIDLWMGLLGRNSIEMLCSKAQVQVQWISCGFEHMAAVTAEGRVLTWGYGGSGSLGHGNLLSLALPRLVEGLAGEKIVYLECGGYHNAAVSEDGEMWVWGRGDVNQLGIDFFKLQRDEVGAVALSPVLLQELVEQRISVKAVACGEAHTLVLDSEGKVYSCGWAEDGQLGLGDLDMQSSFLNKNINVIPGLPQRIVKISAGSTFSACVSENGQVFVWGNGEQGQLGLGMVMKSSKVPVMVNSLGQEFIVDVVCGESHAMCISQHGKIFGWGQGTAGYFTDQTVYAPGSDILCFASRNISTVKTSQEYLIRPQANFSGVA